LGKEIVLWIEGNGSAAVYGDTVVDTLISSIYDTRTIPYLPAYIYNMYAGDYDYAYEILDLPYLEGEDEPFFEESVVDVTDSEGMFYSVECNEEVGFGDLDQAEESVAGYPQTLTDGLLASREAMLEICGLWGAGQAATTENQAVVSDIPTLILNGEYDPVTPPVWAYLAAEGLSNAQVFVFPGYGHAVLDAGPCPLAMIVDFLNDPNMPVDASCIAQIGPPDFVIDP